MDEKTREIVMEFKRVIVGLNKAAQEYVEHALYKNVFASVKELGQPPIPLHCYEVTSFLDTTEDVQATVLDKTNNCYYVFLTLRDAKSWQLIPDFFWTWEDISAYITAAANQNT